MSLFFCMIVTCMAALACMPALVSFAPLRKKDRRNDPTRSSRGVQSGSGSGSIESLVLQTRVAVREVHPTQRRLLEVSEIIQESKDAVSIYLTSADGSELPDFRPGQHLIVERPATAGSISRSRCYTLSNGPKQKNWRITVRRQASIDNPDSFSAWVHRELRVGDQLRVRGPRGSFTLDKADALKPVVLVAAGVGITPMASMLHDELSYDRSRSKWLFYQVRQWDAAPLLDEMVFLVEQSKGCKAWISASQDVAPLGCPSKKVSLLDGKLKPSAMLAAIGTTDITVFLCGPGNWMSEMRRQMVALGVPDLQIHDEAFGAHDAGHAVGTPTGSETIGRTTEKFEIAFESSGKLTTFVGDKPNILAHAKQNAIHIPASCRKGNCGTCAIKLLRGTVKYSRKPEAEIAEGEILPCICLPTSDIAIQA